MKTTKRQVFDLLKKSIRPEFLNRIDETIMFKPLAKREVAKIAELQLQALKKMLAQKDITIDATNAAVELIAKLGFDPQLGARPVKRVIQRKVLNELSKQILAGTVSKDSIILIDVEEGELVFRNEEELANMN